MKSMYGILFLSLFLYGVGVDTSKADDFKFCLSVRDEGKRSFYLAVGSHYKASDKSIAMVKKKGIPDDEMPVVFHLSAQAGVKPEALIAMRLTGKTWADITLHFGLGASIYYVPFRTIPGPPYGKAYGYYKNKPRKDWNKIILSDSDVVHLVNLKFMSKHHGFSPDEVVKFKGKEKNFISIHQNLKKNKQVRARTMEKNRQMKRKGSKTGAGKSIKSARGKGGKKGKK
jgi:hypothetical protein